MSMTKPRCRGFTLIELIIFIVVVSAGLAGILSVMDTVVKSSADPMVRKQAIAIAESLLEEILSKEYATGGYDGAVRAQFDDVSDYHNYTTGITGIKDVLGAAVAGLENYNFSTDVTNTDLGGLTAKKVTVTVTGGGHVIALSGYRANY